MDYYSFILTLSLSAGLCFIFSKLAAKLGLIAYPGEHRSHSAPTPLVGGLAIYFSILFTLYTQSQYQALLGCLGAMCLIGSLDDRFSLPSWVRFVAQAVISWVVIELTQVKLDHLGALFGSSQFTLGAWSTPLTIFAMIGVINAINMSDGMDGLAGSICIVALLSISSVALNTQTLIYVLIASIVGFLVWNIRLGRKQAAVFMGDAGSMMLGMLLAYVLIQSSQGPFALFPPVTALWLLALPLIDAVAVLTVRPMLGKSPFNSDQLHYHHLLRRQGLSVNTTLLIVIIISLITSFIGFWFLNAGVPEQAQLNIFLIIFVCYFIVLYTTAAKETGESK